MSQAESYLSHDSYISAVFLSTFMVKGNDSPVRVIV
jgi:hypothetical protein